MEGPTRSFFPTACVPLSLSLGTTLADGTVVMQAEFRGRKLLGESAQGGGAGKRESMRTIRAFFVLPTPTFPTLQGTTLTLPAGTAAYILPPAPDADEPPLPSPSADAAGPPPPREWRAEAATGAITYWKLGEHPAGTDGQRRALLEWVATATALAAPVPASAVDAAVEEATVVVD